jgi:limonene-1,2-epoxide hydrolase
MKERILAFMDDMHSNDACRVAAWFSDEGELWIPPAQPVRGHTRIKALFRAMFNRYEFLQWNVIDIMPISANRCIHICESHGKLKGHDEYRNRVITDIVFDDNGKIVSLSDYFKDTSVFKCNKTAAPLAAAVISS